jgi:hypothetical protein
MIFTMDANPPPNGNPPTSDQTPILRSFRQMFSSILGLAVLLTPVSLVYGALSDDDSRGPSSSVCEQWNQTHPDIPLPAHEGC